MSPLNQITSRNPHQHTVPGISLHQLQNFPALSLDPAPLLRVSQTGKPPGKHPPPPAILAASGPPPAPPRGSRLTPHAPQSRVAAPREGPGGGGPRGAAGRRRPAAASRPRSSAPWGRRPRPGPPGAKGAGGARVEPTCGAHKYTYE